MKNKSLAYSIRDLMHQVAISIGDFWSGNLMTMVSFTTFQRERILAAPRLIEATEILCVQILLKHPTEDDENSQCRSNEIFIQLMSLCLSLAKSVQNVIDSSDISEIKTACYRMDALRQVLSILAIHFSVLANLDKPHDLDELVINYVVGNSSLYRDWLQTKDLNYVLLQTKRIASIASF